MFEKDSLWQHIKTEDISNNIHEKLHELFGLIEDLPTVIKHVVFHVFSGFRKEFPIDPETIDTNTLRKMIALCLWIKATNTYESLIILIERGLLSDAKVLLRSILETVVRLKAVCRDENYLNEYLGYDVYDYKNILEAMQKHEDIMVEVNIDGQRYDREHTKRRILKFKEMINEISLKKNKTELIAQKVGMQKDYDLIYRFLSIDAHASPKSILRVIQLTDSRMIKDIDTRPAEYKELEDTLSAGLLYFLQGTEEFNKIFNCDIQVFKDYCQRFTKYYANTRRVVFMR